MNQLDNLCPICGGVTTLLLQSGGTSMMPMSTAFKICRGHEKHDGDLGGRYQVAHSYGAWGFEGILIEDKGINAPRRTIALLSPAVALSLLAWFRQEEATLQQLAKEQEDA